MALVAYESVLLGPQFDKFLRAEETESIVSTKTHEDILLVRIDPLYVNIKGKTPRFCYPADRMEYFDY